MSQDMKKVVEYVGGEPVVKFVKSDFDEGKHPRDESGKFSEAGGGQSSRAESAYLKGAAARVPRAPFKSGSTWIVSYSNPTNHTDRGQLKFSTKKEAMATFDNMNASRNAALAAM